LHARDLLFAGRGAFLIRGPRSRAIAIIRPGIAPSFLIFKYQHIVGKEIDDCGQRLPTRCRAHFQLDFTGSSIALDAEIQTGPAFRPLSYSAKGSNSTRSFLDVKVKVEGNQATVRDNGVTRTVQLPAKFFTLQEDVPLLAQQLLFSPQKLLCVRPRPALGSLCIRVWRL